MGKLRKERDRYALFLFVLVCVYDRRVERVAKRRDLSISKAKDEVIRVDKRRAGYYNYYTGRKWGRIENCDLVINVDMTGIPGAVRVIEEYLDAAQG